MKLDYKKTIRIGFAFAIVIIFWQVYDFVIPLLLDNIYGLPDHIRGIIMGLDNLLSLFLLPLFGRLSDNTNSRWGRRTPYIVVGTVLSVILVIFVPISANTQFDEAQEYRAQVYESIDTDLMATFYDDAAQGKNTKYCDYAFLERSGIDRDTYINLTFTQIEKDKDNNTFKFIDGEKHDISLQEYEALAESNILYNNYARSGINTYLADQVYQNITLQQPTSLIVYMIILFFVLVAMATFRSPAVALMPDVTPKPLRSQANAIINLAGGVGGALAFLIYTIWFAVNQHPYIQIFVTMGACMLLLLFGFLMLVNEPKLVQERIKICKEYGIEDEEDEQASKPGEKMEKGKKISFLLILSSIFMWFMGYNAITSNLSIYATRNLLFEPHVAGIITAISMGFSALAFIPVGFLAVKIGRKKSIMIGFTLASLAFLLNFLIVRPDGTRVLFALFYLIAGFGLIIANVNTFPMVVELCKEGDVGKYTGYYYVSTMSAQAITPFIAGLFMNIEAKYLFLYSAVCIAIAVALMLFVKHGDSRMPAPKSKLEMLGADED